VGVCAKGELGIVVAGSYGFLHGDWIMENALSKSGFRLSVGFIGLVVLFGAGSSYAVSSFKNTPLYRHIVNRQNSQQVTLFENKPIASAEQVEAPLKSSYAIDEADEKDNPAEPARPARIPPVIRRPANLMDPSTFTPQMPLSEAIEILRNSTFPSLNISVLWKDLEENADIYPDTPIGVDGVSGVPLRRHLKSLLAGVSGGAPEELGYVVDDGVIIVATLDSLPQRMVTRVYDVTDLVGQPSTGFPQMGMMGMGMPGMGMMGMGMPGMSGMMGGYGMGMPGMGGTMGGYGMGMPGMGGTMGGYGMGMPGMGGIIGGMTPGLSSGYGFRNMVVGSGGRSGTSMGFGGTPYR